MYYESRCQVKREIKDGRHVPANRFPKVGVEVEQVGASKQSKGKKKLKVQKRPLRKI